MSLYYGLLIFNTFQGLHASSVCRLEELLAACATTVKGDLCASPVQECLRKVVSSVPHPSHATNVLKLLIGEKRDALEVRLWPAVYYSLYFLFPNLKSKNLKNNKNFSEKKYHIPK